MTPSGWSDDAQEGDAGHDEMVLNHLKFWRSREKPIPRCRSYEREEDYFLCYAAPEHPFQGYRGRLSGFADIALQFQTKETEEQAKKRGKQWMFTPSYWWLFLELKPKIYSVGALVRQCKAIELLARQDKAINGPFEVWAVVYEDDCKISQLREMYDRVNTIPRPAREVMP